jgi:hypothetical protein
VHGFDVSSLDPDTIFIILFSAIILNSDLRSPAVKDKMTRDVFVQRNSCIPGLTGIPPRFFEGIYDEIAVQGLPMSDDVPMAPVTVPAAGSAGGRARPAPPPETVAVLQRLTGDTERRPPAPFAAASASASASVASVGRHSRAGVTALQRAVAWVRASIAPAAARAPDASGGGSSSSSSNNVGSNNHHHVDNYGNANSQP